MSDCLICHTDFDLGSRDQPAYDCDCGRNLGDMRDLPDDTTLAELQFTWAAREPETT